jgi:transcriptional repressor NrdR
MWCPYCRHPDSRVVDTREVDDGQVIRRRRSCPSCGKRFTTVEEAVLAVVKRSGASEPFSREKVVVGVRKACQGRPVDDDALALLAQRVEEAVRSYGSPEVPSHQVGLAILGPLRELDEVAYLRFASVYRGFESLADFESEISALRTAQQRDTETQVGADSVAESADEQPRAARERAAPPERRAVPTRDRLAPARATTSRTPTTNPPTPVG